MLPAVRQPRTPNTEINAAVSPAASAPIAPDRNTGDFAPARLAATAVIVLRHHPHLNNVLTHISGANWMRLEQALAAVLDPLTRPRDLSPLARNLLDLMCADRGVTGRIMRPYFHEWLGLALPAAQARQVVADTARLFAQMQRQQ